MACCIKVEECVIDAALAVLENAQTDKIADRFLSHRDQNFRLSYILGGWRTNGGDDEQDEMSFEDAPDSPMVVDDEGALTETDRTANREAISAYLDRVASIVKAANQTGLVVILANHDTNFASLTERKDTIKKW